MIKHKTLSTIKNPVIVHYTRIPFEEWSSNEIWGLYIYHNDEYYSYEVNTINDEEWSIYQYAQKIIELLAQGCTIIHWNQTSEHFGSKHIVERFFELTGSHLNLEYGKNSINLAYEMIKTYGEEYISHPRLDSLAALNGFSGAESDEPSPMFNHRRTALIVKIFYSAMNGTLKTLNSEYREKLFRLELLKEINNELRSINPEDRVLSRKQVKKECGISSETLSNLIQESKIPYTQIGRRLYFLKSELLKTI
ncbi:MAG: helix-turn-helix domain-containing protein [Maribacter sp.]